MTSVPATLPLIPNPSGRPPRPQRPDEAAAEYAALVAANQLSTTLIPLVQVASAPASTAKAAQPAAQGQAAGTAAGMSAADADGRRLSQRRGIERPNQVDLAQRAAQELSSPRDPLRLIPPSQGASGLATDRPHPAGAKPAADTDGPGDQTPIVKPAEATGNSEAGAGPNPVPGPAAAPRASTPASPEHAVSASHQQAAAAAMTRASSTPAASAGPGTAVPGSPRPASIARVESAGSAGGAGHPPVRERLWRHLERLGEPAAPARGAKTAAQEPEKFHAQLARGLASALKQGDGRVTLRLSPDALGALRIDLQVSNDRVTAHIATSNEQARRLLEQDVVTLKSALEAAGLGVERIEVVGTPAEPALQPAPREAVNVMTFSQQGGGGGGTGPGGQGGQGGHGPHAPHGGRAQEYASDDERTGLPDGGPYVLRIDFLA